MVSGGVTVENTSGSVHQGDCAITAGTPANATVTGQSSGSVTVAGVVGDGATIGFDCLIVITGAGSTLLVQGTGAAALQSVGTSINQGYPNASGIHWVKIA